LLKSYSIFMPKTSKSNNGYYRKWGGRLNPPVFRVNNLLTFLNVQKISDYKKISIAHESSNIIGYEF
jgi:hypothetical protein